MQHIKADPNHWRSIDTRRLAVGDQIRICFNSASVTTEVKMVDYNGFTTRHAHHAPPTRVELISVAPVQPPAGMRYARLDPPLKTCQIEQGDLVLAADQVNEAVGVWTSKAFATADPWTVYARLVPVVVPVGRATVLLNYCRAGTAKTPDEPMRDWREIPAADVRAGDVVNVFRDGKLVNKGVKIQNYAFIAAGARVELLSRRPEGSNGPRVNCNPPSRTCALFVDKDDHIEIRRQDKSIFGVVHAVRCPARFYNVIIFSDGRTVEFHDNDVVILRHSRLRLK